MKRRTFLALVPATATAGCVVQDRSSALGGSQVAPEAKAIVDFAVQDGKATATLVRATGFERGVVRRVFLAGPLPSRIDWVNVDRPEGARARLPLDDGDSITVELADDRDEPEDLRIIVGTVEGERTVVGSTEVPA